MSGSSACSKRSGALSKAAQRLARRPRNSRLDCSKLRREHGVTLPPWEEQLAEVTLAAR
jgi:dTDP-4-dehydrorhamnose reductase